jgi:hypothetical protein
MEIGSAAGINDIKDIAGCGKMPGRPGWLISLHDLFKNNLHISVREDQTRKVVNGSQLSKDMIDKESDLSKIKKQAGKTFPDIITVRAADGKIIAIHRILQGPLKDNIKSFDKAFTKSVVIF